MVTFRTFGRVELRDGEGSDVNAVLTQPKRLGLLAYLAAAGAGGFRRRDELLALFWPELDESRARAALSKSLHHLRQGLGPGALVARGQDEVGIDFAVVRVDVVAFNAALRAGDAANAIEAYRGEFLAGFHLSDAAEFGDWLDRERAEFRSRALAAAHAAADAASRAGDTGAALQFARRGAQISPLDEPVARRVMQLLDAAGDRSGAIAVFEDLSRRLREEWEVAPSTQTVELANEIIGRPVPPRVRIGRETLDPAPGDAAQEETQPSGSGVARRPIDTGLVWWRARRGRVAAVALALAATAGTVAVLGGSRSPSAGAPAYTVMADVGGSASPELRRIVGRLLRSGFEQSTILMPLEADQVQAGLAQMRRSDSVGMDADAAREVAYRMLARMGGLRTVIEAELNQLGQKLVLAVRVLEADSGKVLAVERATADREDALIAVSDTVVRGVLRALEPNRAALTTVTSNPFLVATTQSFAAYRAFAEGRVRDAIALDSGFAKAWQMLAMVHNNSGRPDSLAHAIRQMERFADRATPREQLEFRGTAAFYRGDFEASVSARRQLLRLHGPSARWYNDLGQSLSALDRHAEALDAYRGALEHSRFRVFLWAPSNVASMLIRLGRYDEARRLVDSMRPRCAHCVENGGIGPVWDIGHYARVRDWAKLEATLRSTPHPAVAAALHVRRGDMGARSGLDREASLLVAIAVGDGAFAAPAARATASVDALVWPGVAAALAGDDAFAIRAADSIYRLVGARPYRGAAPEFIRALVAAQRRRWDEVRTLLVPVAERPEGFCAHAACVGQRPLRLLLARAYEESGLPDSAATVYERLLEPGTAGLAVEPFIRQRLIIVYSRLGQPRRAQDHWREMDAMVTHPDATTRQLLDDARAAMAVASRPAG